MAIFLSEKDLQGHLKSLIAQASDLGQSSISGHTQSAPVTLRQIFHEKGLNVDRNGGASQLPSIPEFPVVFEHLIRALLSQAVHFSDIGSTVEIDPLRKILSDIMQLDADNYTTSDPESLEWAMKLGAKPDRMSEVLRYTSKKDIETFIAFPGSIQKRVIPKEEDTHLEIRELVKSEGDALADTRDRMGSTLLHHAALNRNFVLADALLKERVTIRDSVNKLDRTALHMAALVGDREMVELLVDTRDIDTRDMFGKSSLYLAAENGHTEIVSYLMGLGAEPDTVDMFGLSPLFAAIRGGWLGTVKLLLSKDVDVNRQCKIGATPIHFAALNGDIEMIRVLLDRGAKANLVDKMEATPLMLAARGGHYEVCLKLLEVYTADDVMKANMEGLQAIHFAVANHNLKLVKTLIEHGADTVATISEIGHTLLHFAVICGNHATVSFLVNEAKVNVNTIDKGGSTPLHDAIRAHDADVVRLLLDSGAAANVPDKHGIQAIHCAMKCDLDTVKTLIENGADLDAKAENGLTPLHVAVVFGNYQVVSFLVKEANVDVNAVDQNGLTPLHVAVVFGNYQVASFLVKEANADVNAVDQMNNTPTDLAEMKGNEEFLTLLKQHGGRSSDPRKKVASTEKQTLAYQQGLLPKTQTEKENTGPCSVASEYESSIRIEDPRLRPILKKVDVERMVEALESLLKDAGAEVLTQKNITFKQRNFAMGVIGPKGGGLAFADESVTMTIPDGALSDTRVISCYRPVGLDDDDQGRQPNEDWIFCTPELICGPDGTEFNKPITLRFRHSVPIGENGSCKGENVRVVTKGDNKEKWQEEAGGLQFDGRWVSINIAHFTSVSCAFPSREPQQDNRVDVLFSTGLTVVPPTQPEGAQALDPGTPTQLHVFITLREEGLMRDLKQGRLEMPNNEVSCIDRVICSINPRLDLSIEGHPRAFRFSNSNTITVQLNEMVNRVKHDSVAIAETNQEAVSLLDFMLSLEPDQSGGLSKSVIEHKVVKTHHSSVVPLQITTLGPFADELECRRRHELSRTTPRRTLVAYPIQVSVLPQQLPAEQQEVPAIPLADQIANQVAAIGEQFSLLVDVENN